MNYPFWDVPVVGGAWIIGLIAIFHIPISHFAIGGGLFLPMAEHLALKEGRRDWLPILRRHSKFFLVLTSVFGAVSGVGIWFAIALVQPEATSTLIHNFVFGWAIEWCFFIIELSAAAVYYYTWDRIPDKLHLAVGWLYAVSSICTLVIINGILSFMLTPSDAWLSVAGTGNEASMFWPAFFNQTYWPSLVLRILVCIALAGIWALVTLSRMNPDFAGNARDKMIQYSAKWVIPMFVLMPVAMAWYFMSVPSASRELMQLGMTTIGSGMFTQVTRIGLITLMTTATIALVVYFFAYRTPREFTFAHAASCLALAVVATAATEYAREAIRKPYVIGGHMYSNGLRRNEIAKFNEKGYLAQSMWASTQEMKRVDMRAGILMFRGQCGACHTTNGYRSMVKLIAARDMKAIESLLRELQKSKPTGTYHKYMPPLVGTREEISSLALYLKSLSDEGSARTEAKELLGSQ